MAGVPDNLNIYSGFDGTQLIGYLGTYEIPAGFSGNSINNIMSSLGLSIPQGADGFTINALGSIVGEYGLNETIPGTIFAASGTTYQGWFTYLPEKITGFFLNGTEYKIGGAEYNAGKGIEFGTIQDYSAMQGPAPDGFHVPLSTEWQAVYDIRTALGGGSADGPNFGIALKLPLAGDRDKTKAYVSGQGERAYYWASSCNNNSDWGADILFFESSRILPQTQNNRTYGFSVRCFKNVPVIPTSSWTKLYGTSIESGGIFWSSEDGLISLSSDGQTWITIADKNLGATTVWNSGNALSEANCGKYYQRGNNYGFPRTGTLTDTSTTQVNASTYGPGNYYNSSTFIKYNGRWDTTDNRNLWGGVTGIVTIDNVITNTGVLSVNGQTGDVTIQTGGNYTAGNGIDITNDEIGLDGTYTQQIVHSDMQGPAPDGFHVPLKQEWINIINILRTTFGLSQTASTMGIYLKMPVAGWRKEDSTPNMQGTDGYYWSSIENYIGYSEGLRFLANGTLFSVESMPKAYGLSVRCLKDYPVIPNSNWTTLYNGSSVATGAGVFRNISLGLISLSGDGNTRYTIQDKNLGATTVYNNGDSLSEANCGKYYQWGNNYGFPRTGTVTTSSTRVDATGYGPGNYYNSGTFIVGSNAWDTQHNSNLRGGDTKGTRTSSITNSLVLGDKLYKIVTSTTAPASGTASNIITIVTD